MDPKAASWRGGTTTLPGLGARAAGSAKAAPQLGPWLVSTARAAWAQEVAARRLFLWLPVLMGVGAVLNLTATREPSLWAALVWSGLSLLGASLCRHRPISFATCLALAAVTGGMALTSWRIARVDAPVLTHLRIAKVSGWIEEWNPRPKGARFVLRVQEVEGLPKSETPDRVRLTARQDQGLGAGTFVQVTARLLPPAHAALPGGYDFARDAFFARLGAVGNVLGGVRLVEAPHPAPFWLRMLSPLDHARNALAHRIRVILPGASGAVAVAMVTGKRDYLDDDTKETIREAGIFHIITISGLQMTLVAGIVFWLVRAGLALHPHLALHYPIKRWAALAAMAGALAYDLATGSRVGTERALWMTLILMGAVLAGRRALSMRNLALAVVMVVLLEPEALLGASFQLSFAAVAALIAVWEARQAAALKPANQDPLHNDLALPVRPAPRDHLLVWLDHIRQGPPRALFATLCATSATAAFMAANFHELSPYVLIGNPLTMLLIELVAVPGALLGSLLYPLGLDGPVWLYVGKGIEFVLWAAGLIAAAPGATLHLPAFAPTALPSLALALLCVVVWRTWVLRLTALPFLIVGLWGASHGPHFDGFVAPTGDAVALRNGSGQLAIVGQRPSLFGVEQWLRADGDGRPAKSALVAAKPGQGDITKRCDALGCVLQTDLGIVSVVASPQAFVEDCARADVIVSVLRAPEACEARLVLDRSKLAETGAVALQFVDSELVLTPARGPDEDRPWSRAPKPRRQRFVPVAEESADSDTPDFARDETSVP